MWMCLFCFSFLRTFRVFFEYSSAPVLFLFYVFIYIYFFYFFCCGWKSSRLSQLPRLWLTTVHSQDASVAGWAVQHHTGEPVSGVAALGRCAAHCETAPSSAQCLLYYCMFVVCFERKLRSRAEWEIYLEVWIFGRLILDMNCDDNTALLIDNLEDALAGSDICLSQDILNKSHNGCSDIWSMPCCYGTFGNDCDYWGNLLLSSTTLLHS